MTDRQWFAVRTLVRHAKRGEKATFEERIHLYRTDSANAAAELANRELREYIAMNKEFFPIKQLAVFELGHSDADLHGREVWSHLSSGPADAEEFYRERYGKYDLKTR